MATRYRCPLDKPEGRTYLEVGLYIAEVYACLYILHTRRAGRTLGSQVYLVVTTMCLFLLSTAQVVVGVLPTPAEVVLVEPSGVVAFGPSVIVLGPGNQKFALIQEILYIANK